jgi:ribosomal-protein-alanine N-acetyltransferase
LHGSLVSPPSTRARFRAYLARTEQPNFLAHLVCLPNGELAGVINVSELVRGNFCSAYLGYYAFDPHAGRGFMLAGLRLVIARAFRRHRLHRLEANIQPRNERSIALVMGLGFRREGLSPRYLKIAGRWRDHERFAITREEWRWFGGAWWGAMPRARVKSSSAAAAVRFSDGRCGAAGTLQSRRSSHAETRSPRSLQLARRCSRGGGRCRVLHR